MIAVKVSSTADIAPSLKRVPLILMRLPRRLGSRMPFVYSFRERLSCGALAGSGPACCAVDSFRERLSWVDRVLPHLAAPDIFLHDRLAEFEVVVRRDAGAGVHHQ